MSLEPGAGTVELRASPTRNALLAVLFLGFAVVGAIAALSKPAAWFGAAFFGLLALGLALSTRPSAAGLTLTPEGFTVRSMFRSTLTPWGDVVGFGVGRQPGRGPMVEPRYRSAGVEGLLPESYGMEAGELAALLERWRVAHAGH